MAVLRKKSFAENLETFSVLVNDTSENSVYFKITDLTDTFTGGKNSFLIQGSTDLVQDTIVKVEIKDSTGEIIYSEAGDGIPEYYEGTSKPVAVYVYPDTPYGPCTITILAELAEYTNERGIKTSVPGEWRGKYNIRWQKTVNVNPNLTNISKIRFYRRPKANITETILPVYNRSVSRRTISGSINGSAIQPSAGSNFRTFNGDTVYTLYTTGSVFSSSMEGERITITGLNQPYSTTVIDVVNGSKLLATTPYYETSSNLVTALQTVKNFENGQFTLSYNDSVSLANSTLNASYAKIRLTDLEAFSGDPARVKVFSKRKADIGNFSLIDDVRLESSEIFIADAYSGSINVNTGFFINQAVINDFWKYTDINGNSYSTPYDNDVLGASAKLEEAGIKNSSDYPQRVFYYKTQINFNANTEYELDFTPLLSSSLDTPTKLEVYGSGSAFISDNPITQIGKKITSFNFDGTFRRYDSQQVIFKPDRDGTGTIVFAVYQGNWHLSNITLKASSETNFSPNELTLNVSVPTVVNNDEYEFRFEFYDVNNNYVPVTVVTSSVFTGGTTLEDITATAQFFQVSPDSNIFPFGYTNNYDFQEVNTFASVPIGTTEINFTIQATGLSGSITFTSAAFDSGGLYIDPNTYVGQYPGLLTNITTSSAKLDVANFTGSMASTIEVKKITYTASLAGYTDVISIFKVVEGTPGSDGTNGTNYVIRPLNGTAIKNSNPNVYLEVQITKIDGNTNIYDLSSGNVKLTTGSGVNPPVLTASPVVVAGTNGVEYNARFYAGAINGSLTVSAYDYDQQVIVDTITLADITDGLTTGFIEASNGLILNRDPLTNTYTPSDTAFTASFFDSLGNIYSASLLITPNYSTTDRLKYETGYSDSNITLEYVKTNAGVVMVNNTYYNTTGLTAKYNFTEPNTGVSVSATEGVVITVNGSSGTSGANGSSGTNGTSGANGSSGTNGTSGTNGSSGEPAVVVSVIPATQTTNVTTAGSYSAPANITVSVIQSGSNFVYDDSVPYTNGSFRIVNIVNGTNNNNGTITPTTPSTTAGITTTFDVIYTSLFGTVATSPQSHSIAVALVGQSGPGIVFTGPWESGRAYQYSDTRRDAVISGSENRYYATLQQHTANSSNAPSNGTDNAFWQYLGQEDFFVAAKIAIFKESYVQNTLNVGTTNNGGISSANITLYGATEYPYISIGQANTTGGQGYAVGDGIFIGRDSNDGEFKASFENGTTSYLKWSGLSLDIKGSITITPGGNAATTTDASNAVTSGSLYANNAVLSGSVSSSNAVTSGSLYAGNAALSGSLSASNAAASASLSGSNALLAAANAAASASLSGSVNPLTQQLVKNASPNGTGLYLGANNLGYYNNGAWATYMSSSGDFFLSGSTGNYLEWNSGLGRLNIQGGITATSGSIQNIFTIGGDGSAGTGITLDGINDKIYVGTGTYNNQNTPFYFASGSSDIFSLGNRLTFNGTSLFISGAVSASAGRVGPVNIDLDRMYIGQGLYADANTPFFISSSGDFSLRNGLTWASATNLLTINSGSISIEDANSDSFTRITSTGILQSKQSNITGTVTATAGQIGGWSIRSNNLEAESSDLTKKIVINANRPSIEIYSSSVLLVDISGDKRLSGTGSVNINVSGSANIPLPTLPKISSGSRVVNTGNLASNYSGQTTLSFVTASTLITGSWSASFIIPQSADGALSVINITGLGASGSNSASFNAKVDAGYTITDGNFTMNYGVALYSASANFSPPFIYIAKASKTANGSLIYSERSTVLSGSVSYTGNLTLSQTLNAASYSLIPFIELVSITATATEDGGGCNCPSYGTFYAYGDCVGSQQEVIRYTGTCTGEICDTYTSLEGACL
jgi:hypothetical protein